MKVHNLKHNQYDVLGLRRTYKTRMTTSISREAQKNINGLTDKDGHKNWSIEIFNTISGISLYNIYTSGYTFIEASRGTLGE